MGYTQSEPVAGKGSGADMSLLRMCATGVTRFDEVTLVFSRLQRERQLDEAALSFSY